MGERRAFGRKDWSLIRNGISYRDRAGILLSRLASKYHDIGIDIYHMRLIVEDELSRAVGRPLTLAEVASVQTLCRLEVSARMLERDLLDQPATTTEELIRARSLIVQLSLRRDAIMAGLFAPRPEGGRALDFSAAIQSSLAERVAGAVVEPTVAGFAATAGGKSG